MKLMVSADKRKKARDLKFHLDSDQILDSEGSLEFSFDVSKR
jgi:hypothetical protein